MPILAQEEEEDVEMGSNFQELEDSYGDDACEEEMEMSSKMMSSAAIMAQNREAFKNQDAQLEEITDSVKSMAQDMNFEVKGKKACRMEDRADKHEMMGALVANRSAAMASMSKS